jgi:hypothetical protein
VLLLDQPPLDVEAARATLAHLRRRAHGLAWCAALLTALGGLLLLRSGGGWGVPVLIGAATAATLAALAHGDRRRLLTRLVAQDDAERLDEVRAFAGQLLSRRERARLARSLAQAAAAGAPGLHELGVIRSDRAHAAAAELSELARTFGDPRVVLQPRAVALCRRLLCDAALSPLYNPNLPESDLARVLAVIRADA